MNISRYCKMLLLGAASLAALSTVTSCNDEWTDEQYVQYAGFKAPLDTEGSSVGVTSVYVPYTRTDENMQPLYGEEGLSSYNLPIIISGSTVNETNRRVHVALSDTLPILNLARFSTREELWYVDMRDYASFPDVVDVTKGESLALLPIRLDFRGIDLSDRYVLPLTVVDNEADGCLRNPRKNYASAMLRILPFTDFSGVFQASNVKFYIVSGGVTDDEPGSLATVQTYVVDQNTVFFYAGSFNENSLIRKNFKIYARFEPYEEGGTRGTVTFYTDNEDMGFVQNKLATYTIMEQEDEVQTYIMRRTLIVNDIDYTFNDYLTAPGSEITYKVTGNMTMERRLNTQMPIEDQIIFE